MSKNTLSLIPISKNNAEPAIEVLVRAFRNYPLFKHYFPNETNREKILHCFLSAVVYSGVHYGEAYATSPNLEGIAVWIPSNNYPVTFWKLLRSVPLSKIVGIGRHGGSKLRHFNDYIDSVHQRVAPFKHWFLQAIGIAPRFQGKGFASMLLRPMLSKIDKEYLPCYLETIDKKNISMYEHYGFKIIDISNIHNTKFTNWSMLREIQ
jgi:ribosomal protein S18 acetylase RimI-like enzyme